MVSRCANNWTLGFDEGHTLYHDLVSNGESLSKSVGDFSATEDPVSPEGKIQNSEERDRLLDIDLLDCENDLDPSVVLRTFLDIDDCPQYW
ncbi:hypothetical protein NDU88_000139 [Pleurodeles waltl]|uniref:Uncharacterized protein n=1 Tax=Pleurodeles waltl TaxID=8319 RepID=A0AAV7VVN1_PLEWA|nr:hypothetical protein NDU88_000139 [Pleurodeles waltl]